ncbi:killer cell lectin-like receptor 5 isoform X2 [Mastomys coucha]|uniref:killer cell lectin-like receptor 5 isoform X2 n=1 Tax=Mastomys coucha TaxID=35658 RepID=UPI0012618DE5|nr:killer cell lectin-like receptor 5 isoform X2 [Mastomys coucha]
MSEQEVAFSTVRFHKSSGMQSQVRLEEAKRPRKAGPRVPWQLIVISIGILCSIQLVFVAVFVTNIFQYSQQKYELQKTLNCPHNCTTMQSDIDLKEEMMRNKSIECGPDNDLLESLNREQKRWYSETKAVLDSSQHPGRGVEIYWFCYGRKCYYFIMDRNTWSECKRTCQNYSLLLLKIDNEDELKLLQLQVIPESYWIGLSYDKEEKEWVWIDNGTSNLDLKIKKMNFKPGRCVFLSKARLEDTNCKNSYFCICGKTLDKFPY